MNDVLAIGFDYSTLDPEIAAEARAIAERVRARHRQHVEAIIATGCELLRVKAALAHGHFGEWLAAEFGWTGRTARNYMAAAEHFRTRTETVSVLPPAVIYQLTARSTPQHLRDDIINRLHRGECLEPKELRREIADAAKILRKEQERLSRRRKGSPQVQRKSKKRQERLQARLAAEHQIAEEQRQREEEAKLQIVEILTRCLGHHEIARVCTALESVLDAQWLLHGLAEHQRMRKLSETHDEEAPGQPQCEAREGRTIRVQIGTFPLGAAAPGDSEHKDPARVVGELSSSAKTPEPSIDDYPELPDCLRRSAPARAA